MIKVEKKGKKRYIECGNCGSILSFELGDERVRAVMKIIRCPECEVEVVTAECKDDGWVGYYKQNLTDFD